MAESGLCISGDAKGFATVQSAKGNDMFIATQNQDTLKVYEQTGNGRSKIIRLKPDDFYADIIYRDLRKRRIEFYYGSTYLSQSSRTLQVDPMASRIIITDYSGRKREIRN
jgi:hypothetical protein